MKKGLIVSLIAGLAFCVSQSCFAIPITGLYSTGVDNSGNILPSGIDMHYTTPESGYQLNNLGANPQPHAWTSANNAGWIAPSDGRALSIARLSFSLPSINNVSSYIIFDVAVDNRVEIYLNGNFMYGVGTDQGTEGLSSLHRFTLSSGFVMGTNNLDFKVINGGGPGGLLVANLSGETGLFEPIPEPASVILMLLSGTALCVKRLLKKS